jgi:3-phenylpropionate/cinnamic acid dioxygenase small subunit
MTSLDSSIQATIQSFLLEEAAALDERRYDDWLAMLAEDFLYEMPQPHSTESPQQPTYDAVTMLAHESKSYLQMRFARMSSDYAWAEWPRAFERRFVAGCRIAEERDDDQYLVKSNVLIVRSRLPELSASVSSAGRQDLIHVSDGRLLIRHRLVLIDTELPSGDKLQSIY